MHERCTLNINDLLNKYCNITTHSGKQMYNYFNEIFQRVYIESKH